MLNLTKKMITIIILINSTLLVRFLLIKKSKLNDLNFEGIHN